MLGLFRNAVASARDRNDSSNGHEHKDSEKREKFSYSRPYFLGLTAEEVEHSRDFGMRPIITPRPGMALPWKSGYAECINGGKSDFNEDNSCTGHMRLVPKSVQNSQSDSANYQSPVHPDSPGQSQKNLEMMEIGGLEMRGPLYATYFGLFDGHACYRVSLIASKLLYKHVQEKLEACLDHMLGIMNGETSPVTVDSLVVGALEDAFIEMDNQLDRERTNFNIKGGCTALVAMFFNGKLYVANAGDSRAVLCQGDEVVPMSTDFTPESERARLNYLGWCNPELLHDEFSCVEFVRHVRRGDIGNKLLCRKPGMEGWSLKTIDDDDLRFPLVNGEGKKARVMGTIGVTRGLGDHDLYVFDSNIWIKPFLSPTPEVKIFDLREGEWAETDFLVLGSDGLWDVITNSEAVSIVRESLDSKDADNRYTIAAQELVHEARGSFTDSGWKKKKDEENNTESIASFDDITAFVIPILPYVTKWKDTGQSWNPSFSHV